VLSKVVSNPKYPRAVGMTKTASSSAANEDRSRSKRLRRTQSSPSISGSPEPVETLDSPSLEALLAKDARLLETRGRLVDLIEMVDKERKKVSGLKKISGRMDIDR